MGAEAFPGLQRLAAQAQLMRAQSQSAGLPMQEFQRQQQALGALGGGFSELYGRPGGPALPGASPMPPQPGQASMPAEQWPVVPQVPQGAYASGGPGGVDRLDDNRGAPAPDPAQVALQGLPSQQPGFKPTPGPEQPQAQQPGARQVSLADVIAAIKKHDPKVDDATLAAAAQYYLPFMNADDKLALAEMRGQFASDLQAQKDEASMGRTKARISAADARAQIANDAQMRKLQATIDYHQQLADQAKRRGDQKDMAEQRLQAAAAAEASYQYASELANTSFIDDPEMKAQVQQQLQDEHDATLKTLRGLGKPEAKGTDVRSGGALDAIGGQGKTLKGVAPLSMNGGAGQYNPKTRRIEPVAAA